MRRLIRILAAAVLASSLFVQDAALAQGRGHGYGHERGRGGWAPAEREWRGDRGGHDRGGPDRGGPDRGGRWRDGPPDYAYPGPPSYARRPPPGYGMRRGGVAPPQFRGAIVPDYGRHRLRPPPPGFAWVRMGNGYALVSRETGQIFDMIGD